MRKYGSPTMYHRFCCKFLKEYYTSKYVIVGIRKSESVRRAKRYSEPIQCRVYDKKHHAQQIMPILDFTDQDILDFIQDRGIKLHYLYYREDGSIDVSRRLGCIGCPMVYIKGRREAYKMYPKMLRQYVSNVAIYLNTHPDSTTSKRYDSVYEKIYRELFFYNQEKFEKFRNGIFKYDTKWYKNELEKEFNVNLDFDETKTE